MRELKFRAWDKVDQRMIVDEQDFIPLKVTNKGVLRLSPSHVENLYQIVPSDRCDLMQFTGLKDKNDVEIYEGDIVRSKIDNTSDQWVIDMANLNWHVSPKGHAFDNSWIEFEVIGNIYEHPELV